MVERIVSCVHFGDLHVKTCDGQNFRDFERLIDDLNTHLWPGIDFAFLPGDNAEDGTEEQYRLVRSAVEEIQAPVFIIPGDHDRKLGTLELFRRHLREEPRQSISLGPYRIIFLNALDDEERDVFDFSSEQARWLEGALTTASGEGSRAVLFMHTYPSELRTCRREVQRLIREHRVLLVEMGHTHYNELANDGATIYAATRSTGQIEKGPVGFSIANLDQGVVSWRFRPLDEWPFAMITSPCDRRLIIEPASPSQLVRGTVEVRAKAWSAENVASAHLQVDAGEPTAMSPSESLPHWSCYWDSTKVSNGEHQLTVRVLDRQGRSDADSISVLVRQDGAYRFPFPGDLDSENAIGAWPEKGIVGSQLGPNKNGRKW